MENQDNDVQPRNHVFPLELWQLIIDRMTCSEDIVSLFQACPPLLGLSEGKEFQWRISQLLWLIMPNYLTTQDVLRCRQVSKFWKQTVDRHLAANPRRLSYNSPHLTQMSPRHFTCLKYPEVNSSYWKIFDAAINQHVIVDTNGKNPFLGRYLEIFTNCWNDPREYLELINFSKLLGYHLHHLFIHDLCISSDHTEAVVVRLFQCLVYMPNLKSLKVQVKFSCDKIRARNLFKNTVQLPPNLEALDFTELWFDFECPEFFTWLVNSPNAHQVRKLGMALCLWNQRLVRKLPNLVELKLGHLQTSYRRNEWPRLKRIVRKFCKINKNLGKLRISEIGATDIHRLLKLIAPWNIEELDAGEIWETTSGRSEKRKAVVRSIKHFKFEADYSGSDCSVNLKFLRRSLPNLEYLTVATDEWNETVKYFENADFGCSKEGFSNSVYSYVHLDKVCPAKFSIWRELPKLKMLSVVPKEKEFEENDFAYRRFVREFGNRMLTPRVEQETDSEDDSDYSES